MEVALTLFLMTPLFLSANFGMSSCQTPIPTFNRGSCPPLQLSNPDSTFNPLAPLPTVEDVLPSFAMRSTESLPVMVRAFDFHVVCEVAGRTRGTVSAVSFVVDYECSGVNACLRTSLDNPAVNLTEQFQFNCTLPSMERASFRNDSYDVNTENGFLHTQNPLAGFDTPLNNRCGLCVDPAAGLVEADPVTHCIRKY